ncbi:MAG: hypothetical protein HWN80_14485 [Candidatus Lokiarchaeota archaeon]|nr:hypothetical protein [Candidatus Lokiarchaeota archaeon]
MNTEKSHAIVQEYFQKKTKLKRKVKKFSGKFDNTPEQIFPLLCPTREADWVVGWNVELLYTESGYAEDKCIFKTSIKDSIEEGLWTFTNYKPNESLEFVKVGNDILNHVRIDLIQNEDRSTTVSWNIISTALTKEGNTLVEEESGHAKSNPILKMLEYYLNNGEKISKASLLRNITHH